MRPFFWALLVLDRPVLLFGQAVSRDSRSPRICVATVSNASLTSADLDRLTERRVRNLKHNKVETVAMDSSTTDGRQAQANARECG